MLCLNVMFLAQALSFLMPKSDSTEAREFRIEQEGLK